MVDVFESNTLFSDIVISILFKLAVHLFASLDPKYSISNANDLIALTAIVRATSALFCFAESILLCQNKEQTLGQEAIEMVKSDE